MNGNLKNIYDLLNERKQTLVVAELGSNEFRKQFVDFDYLDNEPLLGYYSFSKTDLDNFDYELDDKKVLTAEKLAQLAFRYSDASIAVGISKKGENMYSASIYNSYTNTYTTSHIKCCNGVIVDDIVDYITYEIFWHSCAIEKSKNGPVKRV